MAETQQSICEWADATFGTAGSNFRVAVRANEEMAELLRAVATGDNVKAAEEAADVVIVLARLFARMGEEYQLPVDCRDQHYHVMTAEHYAAAANYWLSWVIHGISNFANDSIVPLHAPSHAQSAVESLGALSRLLNFDLQAEIDKKMAINRARRWNLDGSGHGYHIKKEEGK